VDRSRHAAAIRVTPTAGRVSGAFQENP
jgi:hypothetical protein